MHLLGEPVHLPSGVDKDDCLGDGQRLIQVTQCVKLPLLSFHIDVELADTLQGQFLDRKSTRLNSSHTVISYAVFCLKKKNNMSAGQQQEVSRKIERKKALASAS